MKEGHNVTPPAVDKPTDESPGAAKASGFAARVQLGALLDEAKALTGELEAELQRAQGTAIAIEHLRARAAALCDKIAKVRG